MGRGAVIGLALTAGACAPGISAEAPGSVFRGAVATYLTDELIQVTAETGTEAAEDTLQSYADCAAAEAMALRGANFARHLRTLTSEEAGVRRADAVYTVSTVRPAGEFVLDGEETRAACAAEGIPGV